MGLRVAFYRLNRLLNEMTVAAGSGGMDKLAAIYLEPSSIRTRDSVAAMRSCLPMEDGGME